MRRKVKVMGLGKELCKLTKPELEELKDFLNLKDDEIVVFDMLSKGKSLVQIADRCGMSESSVSNRIKTIKNKYDRKKVVR